MQGKDGEPDRFSLPSIYKDRGNSAIQETMVIDGQSKSIVANMPNTASLDEMH